jgi:hypothetical protein
LSQRERQYGSTTSGSDDGHISHVIHRLPPASCMSGFISIR